MRPTLAAALAAIALLCGPAEAARYLGAPPVQVFCGDRYCGAAQPKRYTRAAKPRRIAVGAIKPESRPLPLPKPRPLDLGKAPEALGDLLAVFRAPIGAVCAPIRNLFREFRTKLAEIIEPVRPGFVAIRTSSGVRAVVAEKFAARFVGFLRDLEATGYRVTEMGGYSYRRIRGRRILSQHAFGRALDVNQLARDVVSIRMDRAQVSKLARANGLCSGGDWPWRVGGPDLGHFEVCGSIPAKKRPQAIAEPVERIVDQRSIASVFNDRVTACPPYRPNPNRLEAGHPTLPCGTKVEVTNLETGDKAVAIIADKGPCTSRRCLRDTPQIAAERKFDMMPRLARRIRSTGLTPVSVTELR